LLRRSEPTSSSSPPRPARRKTHSAWAPANPLAVAAFGLLFGRRSLSGSLIGGIAETQEMLDFCGEHGTTSDIEVIRSYFKTLRLITG
jgi:hypothetical protein